MNPITGKTYSLAMGSNTSDIFFETIKVLTDFILEKFHLNESELLQIIKAGPKKKFFGNRNQSPEFIS
ncbi:MAG TPA: hypothetical protein VGD14_20110, partial [bacterium]